MLKPLKKLSKAVSITAKVAAGLYAVAIPVGLIALFENAIAANPSETLLISDLLLLLTAPPQLLAAVVLLVLFLVWVHRLSTNLHAVSSEPMQFSANWAVICFFIPFYNLLKPPLMVAELWSVAHGPQKESDKIIQWWWISWIGGGVLGRFADPSLGIPPLVVDGLSLLSSIAALVATLLMVRMVDQLSAAYERTFGEGAVQASVAAPAVQSAAATIQPGWYPDPSGRHQHRWWDGAAWTRSVANDGVPSLDMA